MKAGPRASLQAGVTLVELTVTVVVIAILVAAGVRVFRQHALRARSADAPRELRMLAMRMEGCHKRTGSYALRDDLRNRCVTLPYEIPGGDYLVTGEVEADAFLLKATPLGRQAADGSCGSFTLDHQGRRGVTGKASRSPGECWGDRAP